MNISDSLKGKLEGLHADLNDRINQALKDNLPVGKVLKINHIAFSLQDAETPKLEFGITQDLLDCDNPIFVKGHWICTGS